MKKVTLALVLFVMIGLGAQATELGNNALTDGAGGYTAKVGKAAHRTIGYFETKPALGGERNRICIKGLPDKRLDIYIATAYCPFPSGDCSNVRIDGLWFQASLKANSVHYKDASGCEVAIQFKSNGAEVIQNTQCSNSEHPYLYANGFYKFIKAEVKDEDCAP